MKKITSPSKKINWESLKKKKIPRTALTVGELFKRLERSLLPIHDPDALSAILQLQILYLNGTKRQTRETGEILKRLLIPAKRTSTNMRDLQQRPEDVISITDYYKQRMGPGWKKGKTKEERRRLALQGLNTWAITKKDMRELSVPRENEDFTDFALRCIAQIHGFPPDELKKFYYSVKKNLMRRMGLQKRKK